MGFLINRVSDLIIELLLKVVWKNRLGQKFIRHKEIRLGVEDLQKLKKTLAELLIVKQRGDLLFVTMRFQNPKEDEIVYASVLFLVIKSDDFEVCVGYENNPIGIIKKERAENKLLFWIKDLQDPTQVGEIKNELEEIKEMNISMELH